MNAVDELIESIVKTKNPTVVGLDPDIGLIPSCYKNNCINESNPFEIVSEVIFRFNKDIIDTVFDIVPAVKPQMAFYEKYGSAGVSAFEKTVGYAKSKGLTVIEDAKRNDIGNTAKAYAEGQLGFVELIDGSVASCFDCDFLTVTPFLGSEGIDPFIEVCNKYKKGLFVLVKTSNSSSGEIQDVIKSDGLSISQSIAQYVNRTGKNSIGGYGYSSIGAVVGATYPEEAGLLRKIMPNSFFLVPGYGAQGGSAGDIIACFNPDGLGAVVNSSRGVLYSHMTEAERKECGRESYLKSVRNAVISMKNDIYNTLKSNYPNMIY